MSGSVGQLSFDVHRGEAAEQIAASVIVQATAVEVHDAWSGLSGLPRFVDQLRSVGPGSGGIVEVKAWTGADEIRWNVEFLNDRFGRTLSWRSIGTADVPNSGSLTLHELPFGRGTEVSVVIDYVPPSGAMLDRWNQTLGVSPEKLLHLCLFRFRQLLEASAIATTRTAHHGAAEMAETNGGEQGAAHDASIITEDRRVRHPIDRCATSAPGILTAP